MENQETPVKTVEKPVKPRSMRKFFFYLEIIMLLIWVITLIIFLSQIWTKGPECMSNPLVYGTKYLSEKNKADLSCACKFDNAPEYTLYANPNGSRIEKDILGFKLNSSSGSPEMPQTVFNWSITG